MNKFQFQGQHVHDCCLSVDKKEIMKEPIWLISGFPTEHS